MKTAFAIFLGIVLAVVQTVPAAFAPVTVKKGCCEKACQCPPVDCCAPQPTQVPVRLPMAPMQVQQVAKQQIAPATPVVASYLPQAAQLAETKPVPAELLPATVPLHQRNCVLLI